MGGERDVALTTPHGERRGPREIFPAEALSGAEGQEDDAEGSCDHVARPLCSLSILERLIVGVRMTSAVHR